MFASLLGLFPIALLFILMLWLRVPSHWSALITLVSALLAGLFLMPETGAFPEAIADTGIFPLATASLAEGILKSVFPILIIIYAAIFSYNVLSASGKIEIINHQFMSMTSNRGLTVLMITWGFGGLLEGMAGFGTAVAIPAALLIGLGFKPMFSAMTSLLANSVSTAFGAVGVPMLTLIHEVSKTPVPSPETVSSLSLFCICQLSLLFFLIPFVILTLSSPKYWKSNFVYAIITGAVTLGVELLSAKFLGVETPTILGAISSIGIIWILTRNNKGEQKYPKLKFADNLRPWSLYIIILLLILITGPLFPSLSQWLKSHVITSFQLPVTGYHFRFAWLGNAGTMLVAGSFAGAMILGLSAKHTLRLAVNTAYNLRFTFMTIISLITLAVIMNNTGMTSALATGLFTLTGKAYPLFAPLVGAIGTFVTGSDTSANILFGKLQSAMGNQLGLDTPASIMGIQGTGTQWIEASNCAGATGGKIISPQSIAIATGACGMKDQDDALLRKALPYALGYIALLGAIVFFGLQ